MGTREIYSPISPPSLDVTACKLKSKDSFHSTQFQNLHKLDSQSFFACSNFEQGIQNE